MKINDIMKQAQELQKKLKRQQDELATKEFEASSGGGMVTCRASGTGQLLEIKIDPEIVNKSDIDMLQDLVLAAVNEVLQRVQEATQNEMTSMMSSAGLKIPGMF